jgi:imidazolonepropionase-like amidohydrolase
LKDYGTIEVGKAADILLLGADPTVDIRNIRKLEMVMKGGAVIDHKELPTVRIWTRNP